MYVNSNYVFSDLERWPLHIPGDKSECMDCLLRHNNETLEENPDQPPLQRDGWCKEVAMTRSLIIEELNTQPTSNVP